MAMAAKTKRVFTLFGQIINEVLSVIVFSILDLLDLVLCFVYKVADSFIEAEWKPCYCSSPKEAITSSGKILVSERGESRIVSLSSTKLELEEISDTLYARPSLVSELSKVTINELKRIKVDGKVVQSCKKIKKSTVRSSSTCSVNSTIVEMLQEKIGGQKLLPIPRWSDCDCNFCTSWSTYGKRTLFVKAEGAKGDNFTAFDIYQLNLKFPYTLINF